MIRPRLIIFAKAPIMGYAKTRLASDIGRVHAKRIYRAMMSRVIRSTQSPVWETFIAVTPPQSLGQVVEWCGQAQFAQVSGTLSDRLADVFSGKGPMIVIGTDTPQMSRGDIHRGLRSLQSHKAVLGPASDGGFWLIGMIGPVPKTTFDEVRWSSPHTLSDMAGRIDGSIHYLRTLTDIDDAKGLRALDPAYRFSR